MNTGTISLAADSTTVTGTGTEFTSEVNAGDFIFTTVNGINFTLGVNSVDSDTSITLAANYSGATISGLGFSTVPQGAVIGITAQIAADTARAIRGLNYDKQNWQQILTGAGDVTVNVPDGSQYTGPSWPSLADNALMKPGNLSGISDINAARSNIGITTQNSWTKIIKIGDVVYQSWLAAGTAIGSYNANTIGGTTWYTHYFKFTLPLSLDSGINSAVASLVGSAFGSQNSEIPAFVRVRRDTDDGSSVSKTTITIAITTPVTGWVPYIHLIVTGA